MTEHDRTDTSAGATEHHVPATLRAPIVPTGQGGGSHFDPVSLRPAVDADAIEARLAELGASRSTAALGERADLLRMLGRLDEALAISEEAFRLAHFTGDRADATAARIRRAYVFKEQRRLERALNDLHTSRLSAATEEWHELEAAAAELEGYTLFELGRGEEARTALTVALAAYEKSGAPVERTNGLRVAIEGVMRSILQANAPAPVETTVVEPAPAETAPPRENVVTTVVVEAPITLADVPGASGASGVSGVSSTGADRGFGGGADRGFGGGVNGGFGGGVDGGFGGSRDARDLAELDGEEVDDEGDTAPSPQFRTTGSPAFLGAPDPASTPGEPPARLAPEAPARLDPDAPADGSVSEAASIGVETQAIAVPHATAPGRVRLDADDEDRNEDDEPGASGFDAEVARARKAARSIWGAFDASNQKTPPSDRS